MYRWFLARHGETDWNIEGRAQGLSDPPLNDSGLDQARALAARLSPVSFVAAYASDLRRAVDTAEPITSGREMQLKTLPDLREKHFGDWEGMTYREVATRCPELYAGLFANDPSFAPPGGESDLELLERVSAEVTRMTESHLQTEGNLLVVAHGGVLRAMILSLLGLTIDTMWRFRLSTAGLSVITVFGDGDATLDLMNDTSHLGVGFEV